MKNTWERFFNNFSVMVVYKRVYFGERPYKCLDCGNRFNCSSSLKTHYKLHKQQHEEKVYAGYDVDSSQEHVENEKKSSFKRNEIQQTYTGNFYIFPCR